MSFSRVRGPTPTEMEESAALLRNLPERGTFLSGVFGVLGVTFFALTTSMQIFKIPATTALFLRKR